jgi:hypothetical protein
MPRPPRARDRFGRDADVAFARHHWVGLLDDCALAFEVVEPRRMA